MFQPLYDDPQFRGPTSLDVFRSAPQKLKLHRLETTLVTVLCVHLCLMVWAIGSVYLWTQLASLGLSIVEFSLLFFAREHSSTDGKTTTLRAPAKRILKLPLFWLGAGLLVYILIQALNPAWQYKYSENYWWMEPLQNAAFLPSAMDVPFQIAGPWRAMIVFGSLWLTACAMWTGLERRRSYQIIFTVLVINAFLLAIVGLAQNMMQAKTILGFHVVSTKPLAATFIYRNQGGAYFNLMVALGLAVAWWMHLRALRHFARSSPAALYVFFAICTGLMVVFSYSRMAAISLALLAAITSSLFLFRHVIGGGTENSGRNHVGLASLGLIFLVFLGVGFVSMEFQKVLERFNEFTHDPVASAMDRWQASLAGWDMLKDRWVFGWGAGCFRFGFPIYAMNYPDIYYSGTGNRKLWEHTHNDWLQFPIEFGAVGMIFIAGALLLALYMLCKNRFWRYPMPMMIALGCGLALLHGVVDFVFQNPAVLFTWVAMLIGAIRWSHSENAQKPESAPQTARTPRKA